MFAVILPSVALGWMSALGQKADIRSAKRRVRFASESGPFETRVDLKLQEVARMAERTDTGIWFDYS